MTTDGPQPLTGYRLRDYDDLIATLRESWLSQGVSQGKLAEQIGCLRIEVSRWLLGHVEARSRRAFALADALGYDLALIPHEPCDHPTGTGTTCGVCGGDVAAIARDTGHTPDVDYLRGAREALANVADRIADLDGTVLSFRAVRQVLEGAAADLGVDVDAPETAPASTLPAEQPSVHSPPYVWPGCQLSGDHGCTPRECRRADTQTSTGGDT